MGDVVHLNDHRPAPVINDGGKARIQRRRARLNLHEPFHEDVVVQTLPCIRVERYDDDDLTVLRPDPELPCDCQPSA